MMKNFGFTLIELLIVIVIMTVLVVLALPSYQDSIRKTRRADAQADLIEFAGSAERIYTQSNPNSYVTAALPADTDFYTYTFPATVTATTYTIRATPTARQDEDGCGTMTLTQTGQRTYTGSLTGCW